jgi:hypothetical protein
VKVVVERWWWRKERQPFPVLYSPRYVPYGFHMEWGLHNKNLPSPLWNPWTIPPGIHGPFHVDSMESFHLESIWNPWTRFHGFHLESIWNNI